MSRVFVDTNVFLRFLTNDDPAKARRAERLFHDATSGRVLLTTSVLVIAEIVLSGVMPSHHMKRGCRSGLVPQMLVNRTPCRRGLDTEERA